MASIDMSEVTALAVDFGRAGETIPREVRNVVKKGAQNVKEDMVGDAASSSGSTKHFAGSISYTMTGNAFYTQAEIGPDKGRTQGPLGNLLYFGSANGGPVLDIEIGLRPEGPRLTKALGDLAEKEISGG